MLSAPSPGLVSARQAAGTPSAHRTPRTGLDLQREPGQGAGPDRTGPVVKMCLPLLAAPQPHSAHGTSLGSVLTGSPFSSLRLSCTLHQVCSRTGQWLMTVHAAMDCSCT